MKLQYARVVTCKHHSLALDYRIKVYYRDTEKLSTSCFVASFAQRGKSKQRAVLVTIAEENQQIVCMQSLIYCVPSLFVCVEYEVLTIVLLKKYNIVVTDHLTLGNKIQSPHTRQIKLINQLSFFYCKRSRT